ncbi:MAG: thioredoxin [Myxococcales bacterium]|nr:thioredoxin [Myxococcales bacterium]
MSTIEVTDQNFKSTVLEAELPILVDFWATWCAPCRAVAPVLEELSEELAGKVTIGKLDVDANPMLSTQLRIQSIPTMVLFDKGRPVTAAQGALPKEHILAMLNKHVPGLKSPVIEVAELAARLQAGLPTQIIDLRDPRDVSRSHLRRTVCVAEADLPAAIMELPPQVLVVLVDRTGQASEAAAKGLAGTVPHEVVALRKGILEWEGDGHPTYNDREEAELDGA